MELTRQMGPLLSAALCGLAVTAAYPRPGKGTSGRWVVAFGAATLLGTLVLLNRALGGGLLTFHVLRQAVGVAMLVVAVGLALRASRWRAQADVLTTSVAEPLDKAVENLPQGARFGVFSGRLGATAQVTSPGGIVGAFYEAEVRAESPRGGPGALLSVERGASRALQLKGEAVEANVSIEGVRLAGPVQVRKCLAGGQLALDPSAVFAEGELPSDALSYERVGKLGEACVMVGWLQRTAADRWMLGNGAGQSLLVVLGEDVKAVGQELARKAWLQTVAAAALCVGAAMCLAG